MTTPPQQFTLPLAPIEGTADPDPLVSFQQYQSISGDTVTSQEDVEDALSEAIDMVCQECTRTLAYGQYSEVQFLYDNGMVFPSAVPIDPAKAVTSNSAIYDPATDNAPGSIIQGFGVWVGWFTPLPWMPIWSGILDPQTNLIYWGGYRQSTLPPKLRRLIVRIAFKSIVGNNNWLAGLAGGVKSVSVNGVSISGSLTAGSITDSQIKRDLRRFRRPQVEAWQT